MSKTYHHEKRFRRPDHDKAVLVHAADTSGRSIDESVIAMCGKTVPLAHVDNAYVDCPQCLVSIARIRQTLTEMGVIH